MKLVALSDMHSEYNLVKIPESDFLCIAGDIDLWEEKDAYRFNKWLAGVPCKHKIVVYGNHDQYPYHKLEDAKKILTNAIILNTETIELDGVKFFGCPTTLTFFDWFFMANPGEQIKKYWNQIQPGTDVIITHSPPFGVLDYTARGAQIGCKDLLEKVNQVGPKLHLFGHNHNNGGSKKKIGNTWFANVSVMNEDYEVTNQPKVFDI